MSEGATSAKSARRSRRVRTDASAHATVISLVLEDARKAGLFDGERTEHVSFRAPKALLEAAQRESGTTSPTELGLLALAMLAQPDPIAQILKRTRGQLGPDHTLEY